MQKISGILFASIKNRFMISLKNVPPITRHKPYSTPVADRLLPLTTNTPEEPRGVQDPVVGLLLDSYSWEWGFLMLFNYIEFLKYIFDAKLKYTCSRWLRKKHFQVKYSKAFGFEAKNRPTTIMPLRGYADDWPICIFGILRVEIYCELNPKWPAFLVSTSILVNFHFPLRYTFTSCFSLFEGVSCHNAFVLYLALTIIGISALQ